MDSIASLVEKHVFHSIFSLFILHQSQVMCNILVISYLMP